MLATLVDAPFHEPGWVYEEKYDGIRILAEKDGRRVRLVTRNLIDRSADFPEVAAAVAKLPAPTLLLDGEVVLFDPNGISRFGLFGADTRGKPVYVVFDVLYARGRDLRGLPFAERRAILEKEVRPGGPLRLARRLASDGFKAFEAARERGLEGIVAKDAASTLWSAYEKAIQDPKGAKETYELNILNKANEPQLYADDDQVRQAVVSGRAIVGMVASDEAAKAAASAAHVLLVYPNQKSIGTFVWPTALSIPKSARNREAARKLAERLADRNTEQLLVARVPGYLPLRSDIPVPPGVRSAANLVVVSVDPARIVSEIGQRKAALASWAESIPKPLPTGTQAQTR